MKNILMYSSDYCPFCMRAKALFSQKGYDFEEINVDGNPALRQEMIQKAGRTSVPQIWIDGQHVGGCDEVYAMNRSGSLDQIMNQDTVS